MVTYAETVKGKGRVVVEDLSWRDAAVGERLTHALVRGITNWIVEDTEEMRQQIEQQLGMPLPPEDEKLPPEIELALSGLMAQAAQQVLTENQAGLTNQVGHQLGKNRTNIAVQYRRCRLPYYTTVHIQCDRYNISCVSKIIAIGE